MRSFLKVAALSASLVASGAANAQSWGVYIGQGYGHSRYDRGYDYGDRQARYVCSGQRAYQLEDRLRHEVQEREIDYDDADRIHDAIDSLENRQRHECAEGDYREINEIAMRYDRIDRWIDREAHGDRWRGW